MAVVCFLRFMQTVLPSGGYLAQFMRAMRLPDQPVTLSVEQLQELTGKLSRMRHDINNQLSLIVAAAELIRRKPDSAERMLTALLEQPNRISDSIKRFSSEFEATMGIDRT